MAPRSGRGDAARLQASSRCSWRQELQQADSLFLDEAAKIGARRIFVDGVAGVIGGVGGQEPRETFHVLVEGLSRENLAAVLALEASAVNGDKPTGLPEESIADTVIRLRMEEISRATVRSLEIVKSRGHDFQMGRHSFRIVDGTGFRCTVGSRRRAEPAATGPLRSIRRHVYRPGTQRVAGDGRQMAAR